jgi:hypothetical protein
MRKPCLAFLSILLCTCCLSYGQEPVNKITHHYFRSDPFSGDFSSFLKHLLNDPTITDKTLKRRTDTSLFYFNGSYTTYNPFFFKPKRVEVILSEAEVKVKDSLAFDTIYLYQLFAFNDDTENGIKEIKKEFEKIYKRYRGSFDKNTLTESPAANELKWATCNFFSPFHAVAPFALTWIGPDEAKEICLILTIRMSSSENKAVLPVPLYAP